MTTSEVKDAPTMDVQHMLKEVSSAATQFDVLRFLKRLTEQYRSRAFIVLRVPTATTFALQSVSVISSWPSEMLLKYDAEGWLSSSRVVERIRGSSLPFQYDVSDLYSAPESDSRDRVIDFFKHYRMPRGAYFPVSDPSGERAGIGFSGDREQFDLQEMLELHLIATHVFEKLQLLSKRDNRFGDDLTQREVDCLNWTAAGKTSVEISEILGLSEHTVNHYLNRATKKLDTVNRTQAVAKALRTGIIS